MLIRKITREDSDFYSVMGPIFGSRSIERATHDRFYDDPGKVWYVSDHAVASMLHYVLRNFYAKDNAEARELLEALLADYPRITGVIPNNYREIFREYGFFVKERSKNFVEVIYEAN